MQVLGVDSAAEQSCRRAEHAEMAEVWGGRLTLVQFFVDIGVEAPVTLALF